MTDKHQIADDLTTLAYPIEKLKHLDGNPRKGNVEAVKKSYEKFGQRKPIVATKDGEVISGNHQLAAAKELGWNKIAVVFTDDDELTAKAFALADNRTADLGTYDDDLLADMLGAVSSDLETLEATSFTEDDLYKLIGFDEVEEKELPEIPKNPKTKLGDKYKLGNHYLLCGDANDYKNLEFLLQNQNITMIFTDPPYNYKTVYGGGAWKKQANKVGKSIEFMSEFNPQLILDTSKKLFNDKYCGYFFCNKDLVPNYLNWAIENNYNFNILSWHKKSYIPMGGTHHFPDTEYCIFISKNPVFNEGLSKEHYQKYWIMDKDNNIDHPTAKPLTIIKLCIELNSKINNNVLDFFGGSGSTLIAAEMTKRNCYMIELDPKYCDVIIERWENLSGQKAELIESI